MLSFTREVKIFAIYISLLTIFANTENFNVSLMLQCSTLFLIERPMEFDDLDPGITIKQLADKGREPLYYI